MILFSLSHQTNRFCLLDSVVGLSKASQGHLSIRLWAWSKATSLPALWNFQSFPWLSNTSIHVTLPRISCIYCCHWTLKIPMHILQKHFQCRKIINWMAIHKASNSLKGKHINHEVSNWQVSRAVARNRKRRYKHGEHSGSSEAKPLSAF